SMEGPPRRPSLGALSDYKQSSAVSGSRSAQDPEMAKTERSPFHTLQALIAGRDDLVSRIAAPLWSRVGRTLQLSELSWVRSLFGEDGPETLVEALSTFDALDQTGALRARGLSHFLSALLGDTDP